MNEKQMRRLVRREGFTLVELLIVLGILVMLFAIVGPRVLRSGQKADVKAARAQISAFKGMLDHYHVDMKSFPASEQGLTALYQKPQQESDSQTLSWDGPYGDGDAVPTDPWGNPYHYEWPSTHGRDNPDIWSAGPDGESGTEDDIRNWTEDSESSEDTK